MSETAQVTQMPAAAKIKLNQGFMSGRITTQRRINTQTGPLYLTVLKQPAADEFSHPATVEIRSSFKLGENGDDWKGLVNMRGMPNSYDSTDKETGEKRRIISARNEFEAVEQ